MSESIKILSILITWIKNFIERSKVRVYKNFNIYKNININIQIKIKYK
jgi:hypothetical protein